MTKKQKKMLRRIIITVILMIVLHIAYEAFGAPADPVTGKTTSRWIVTEPVWFILYMIPYLIIGHDILKKAFKGIMNRQVFDENFLMAIATLGAIGIALIQQNGEYTEAVAVMLFYQTGELFQSYAVGKSRRNISALMDIRPDHANLVTENGFDTVDPDEVKTGSIILVQPGEKIPIDGRIVSGETTLNTGALTGESLPKSVREGDDVISGCINMTGVIKIQTTREFGESTVSKILDLVENSSSRKSRSENFISRFAKYYTPIVCYGALALALLPPIVLMITGNEPKWSTWIYRALTFLVISCPCALVISIPLTFFAGIGGGSRAGILIKGSNYLEQLSKIKTVAMDKTGTMTKGVFEVSGIHHSSIENEKLLEYAALAESFSTHPISLSIRKAYLDNLIWTIDEKTGEAIPKQPDEGQKEKRTLDTSRVESVEEIGGNGVLAIVDKKQIALGNRKLMDRQGVTFKECHHNGTVIHVAIDGVYSGHIVISDVIKPTAKEAIRAMHAEGVNTCIILTGDSKHVAESVGKEIGVDKVYAELLPEDKVSIVEELLSKKTDKSALAFVGDGINDAPVLSRADVGIAMGALGSDAAIEAADIVLMDDDPLKIARAIAISRRCMRIVYENIYFAIGIKVLCLILGTIGLTNMWLAVFADVGVMVLAVLNALRALRLPRV
ncbi:MAG: heavy metal translocating P-type ATPase [Lachnospiraceae bacterium]|nr:heavy metal translocating P-type ATPase [Lachnospiraceae bacterium]MBR4174337.1 heavy metal translocating P-type ATPase [Lachnospiraceae bacterium]